MGLRSFFYNLVVDDRGAVLRPRPRDWEGREIKGGQNPSNTSISRPPKPGGSAARVDAILTTAERDPYTFKIDTTEVDHA